MANIKLYNTLARKKEEFKPIDEAKVGIYTCGPTVYNFAHIGNLRAYIFDDLLVRTLRYSFGDDKVRWVMNITDVDDKTIRDSKAAHPGKEAMAALLEFTCSYEKFFWDDLKKLNVSSPDSVPHAADARFVAKMQDLVKKIYDKGYAYVKDGSVYFSIGKYQEKFKYGQLLNLDLSSLKTGARVDADEYAKDNVQDFVLWKGKKEGEPFWDFKLGADDLPGRPGWHIECSAMGQAELGMPFDIHAGGEDLKFPHHEDEIAQSSAGFDIKRPVNYWLHSGMLLVDGQKMSKSLNNFYRLSDLEKKTGNVLAYRYLCLLTHYRKPLDFSWLSLDAAKNGLEHLYNQVRELGATVGKVNEDFKIVFKDALDDDLNMPQALAVVQELMKSGVSAEDKLATVLDFDRVLGLGLDKITAGDELPEEIKVLMSDRDQARAEKRWNDSDTLRAMIESKGYIVEDGKEGTRVRKK